MTPPRRVLRRSPRPITRQARSTRAGHRSRSRLGANGVSDVAGYVFSWSGSLPGSGHLRRSAPTEFRSSIDPYTSDPANFAAATTLGGSATVSLVPPTASGLLVLTVASLDRAFNESPPATFFIFVKPDAPTITQQNPSPKFDKKAQFHLTPDPGIAGSEPSDQLHGAVLRPDHQTFTVRPPGTAARNSARPSARRTPTS